jgi:hypothetical protein
MNTTASALLGPKISLAVGFEIGILLVQRIQFSSRRQSEIRISALLAIENKQLIVGHDDLPSQSVHAPESSKRLPNRPAYNLAKL